MTLRAVADVTRLHVVQILADGSERSVTDLVVALHMSQPLVSWHLRILRRCGLINTRKVGRQVFYRMNSKGWETLRQRLDSLLLSSPRARDTIPLLSSLPAGETVR